MSNRPSGRIFFPDTDVDADDYSRLMTSCRHLQAPGGRRLKNEDMQRYHTMYGFNEEQITQFLEAFSVFDKNNDNEISQSELGSVMFALGQRPSDQQLAALVQGVDAENNGTVSFDKFMALMAKKRSSEYEAELREVFDVFDINADGRITADELHEILRRLGEEITEEEVHEMIKEADTNCDGAVDYKEFKGILNAK